MPLSQFLLHLSLFAAQIQISGQVTLGEWVQMMHARKAAAEATVSPSSLSFGTETVGSSTAAQAVTVSNTGGSDLSITSIALTGSQAGDYSVSANTCGTTLASGSTCFVSIVFSPSTSGSRTASLVFTDSASSSPQSISLSGTGQYGPAVSVSPTSLTFGSQTVGSTSAAQPVTLTNSGGTAASISSIALGGTNSSNFAISANTCGTSLAAGANCSVSITFTPSATGTRSATLSFTDNAPGSPQSVAITGTGAASGGVTISASDDIQTKINANPAGTTFVISGTHRITTALVPKAGDTFVGATSCNPIATPGSCTAIISGSVSIGALATFDGTNYKVTGQTQHGAVGTNTCEALYPGCIYPEALFFDGVPYKHLAGSSLPTIRSGQWWFDYAHQTIYFHDNPSGHLVETSVAPAAFGGRANNVRIQYLQIEEFANTQQTGTIDTGSPSTTSGIGWIIEDDDIRLNSYWGVRVNYKEQILNNYIYENGDEGIGGGCSLGATSSIPDSGILISGNTVDYNNFAGVNPGFGAGGIKVGRCRNIKFVNNTVQHNNGEGIHCDVSCEFPFMDGNTVTDNDDDGLQFEIGGTGTNAGGTFRNNIVQRNGSGLSSGSPGFNLIAQASSGLEAYCNVVEIPSSSGGVGAMAIVAGPRGSNPFPPGGLYAATRNNFHHNTVIWDGSSTTYNGATQFDATNEPNFFSDNIGFDYNEYHFPNLSLTLFRWDGNDTGDNTPKTFAQFQSAGEDPHGTADTNNVSGFPTVSITSPVDQSLVGNSVSVVATASQSGTTISKVEFYVDWVLKSTITSGPFTYTWAPTSGAHVVAAMAYNAAGVRACNAVTVTH